MKLTFKNIIIRACNFTLFTIMALLCGFGLYGGVPEMFNIFKFATWTLFIFALILMFTRDEGKDVAHMKSQGRYPVHPMFYTFQMLAMIGMTAATAHYWYAVMWLYIWLCFMGLRKYYLQRWDMYKAKPMVVT